jgi:hypothetical protein
MSTTTTYKPGETVPRNGTVECKQVNGTRDNVIQGTRFAPCDTGAIITENSAPGSTSRRPPRYGEPS